MGNKKYEATIDQLRSLANGSLHHTVNEAGDAYKKIDQVTVKHDSLSPIPSCVQFQKVLGDAMATYTAVVEGIKQDVAKFHQALHDTANTMEKNDESAAAGIAAIARKLNGPLETQDRGQRAYRKHHSLHDGKIEDAPNVGSPASGQSPATGAPGSQAGPASSTSATPPNSHSTTYDAKTGNPVPTSSTSAGSPTPSSSSTPTPAPSASATPTPTPTSSATPTPTPTPTPSTSASPPPG